MENILFLNHKEQRCGVYQYGHRIADILQKSKEYNFIYCEVESLFDLVDLIYLHKSTAIIYNYHPSTMGWVNSTILNSLRNIKHYGIHHEGNNTESINFDYYLLTDSTQEDALNKFSLPRPLFEFYNKQYLANSVPVIGSFGFGFVNKGFERLCSMVNEQFDEAIIRLHIPFAFYGDNDGHTARSIINNCRNLLTKPNVKLEATHDFLNNEQLLDFLAENTINAFLYDEMNGRGLSSVIDYALSVKVPVAISNSYMFRHIYNANPAITVDKKTLPEIISDGYGTLEEFKNKWSNEKLISKFEYILNKTLHPKQPKVLLSILARDKEATLPLYLRCIENLDYEKKNIYVYIRTNDNNDNTRNILSDWLVKNIDRYAGIEFEGSSLNSEMTRHHTWNSERFKILGGIRNESMQKTIEHGCDYYFVVDCDNFILPHTLKKLVSYGLPIVAPLLKSDQGSLYANYHADVDDNGYLKNCQLYTDIFSKSVVGIKEVPVVHCTYLIKSEYIPKLTYDDDSYRYEYVIFSDSARKNNVPQFIDNTVNYGIITFNTKNEEMLNFEEKFLTPLG